jgi:hypothetical protein
MLARANYAEYLLEVREQVCARCPERVAGRPPFRPQCRQCGIELQLPQIVESIRDAGGRLSEFDPAPARRAVCSRCVCLEGGTCPCPAAPLSEWVVRAVLAVEERRAQRERLRLRLDVVRVAPRPRIPVGKMIAAYEAASGTCVGCD